MKIDLRPEQMAWLKAQVSAGIFANEQAAFDAMFPSHDDAWVKPYLDEALADIATGKLSAWNADEIRRELHQNHPDLSRDKH